MGNEVGVGTTEGQKYLIYGRNDENVFILSLFYVIGSFHSRRKKHGIKSLKERGQSKRIKNELQEGGKKRIVCGIG